MARPRAPRRAPFNNVRSRLVLLSFAITGAAVGFVYLYVVPQLTSSLTAERLERLETQGTEELDRLRDAELRDLDQRELESLVRRSAAGVDARITVLGVREGAPQFVIADSELESDSIESAYPAAQGAIASGQARSAVETVRGRRIGETAIPVLPDEAKLEPDGLQEGWVVVLSTPLDDVEANVALIRRQTLIGGGIALVAALIASYLAAGVHARRLRRLEHAAERVARGDFGVPIPPGRPDEVGQLALKLDEMQRRLRRLDSARREFIANASHELRTPIASLGGFIELLDEEEDLDPESRREFYATMRDQIDRLTKLSTDLLDLSRLDSDAMQLSVEELDIADLAEAVGAEFAVAADRHRTRIEVFDGPEIPLVQADRARTMQIMRILIDNALKHTPQGTEITIAATARDSKCLVSVTDDGPGIDPRSRDRVFDRFFTADAVSGSGLGLAIARELALLMGGDLRLETRRRRTTFTLELPSAGAVGA